MPPKKKAEPVNAADVALAEVTDQPVVVKFRGQDFSIPQKALRSVALNMALAANRPSEVVYALLKSDPEGTRRFVALCTDDDDMYDVTVEFADALKEAGQGNS